MDEGAIDYQIKIKIISSDGFVTYEFLFYLSCQEGHLKMKT